MQQYNTYNIKVKLGFSLKTINQLSRMRFQCYINDIKIAGVQGFGRQIITKKGCQFCMG